MTYAVTFAIPGVNAVEHCGGKYRPEWRGIGTISGVTRVDGSAAACRVTLFTEDATVIGNRRTGADGTYSFIGLADGDYMLRIDDDRQGIRRSKVEHVRLANDPIMGDPLPPEP